MNKEHILKINSILESIILERLNRYIDSSLLMKRLVDKSKECFSESIQKVYNSRLRETKELETEFNREQAVRLSLESGLNRVILSIKEEMAINGVNEETINKVSKDLNNQLKGNLKLKLKNLLLGEEITERITESFNSRNNYIKMNQDYSKEDFVQRLNSNKNLVLKEFFNTSRGRRFLTNLSRLNDTELTDKLFSKNLNLLESIIKVSYSIDCEDCLEIIAKSLGLLKMITCNPKVINSIEKKPKLLRLFKDKEYDSVASNNAKRLSDIFIKIPNRISRSNPGQLNISNDNYSKLNNRTREYIDDYRSIMSDYYPENLVDVFESKIYSAIADGLESNELEESLRINLIEHFSNYYLDIFNNRRKKNIYENKMNNELSKYFVFNSSMINAHKYALKELNRYILSEGLFDKLKQSLFGGKISSGMAGKLNNWFKNTSVMKFMKKVSNSMNSDIEKWEEKLNPNQKKMFNDYPHLKAVFATGGLDTNLAVHLIRDESMLRALNQFPNLAVIISKNPKVADLLLKRDKRLLPKIMENPEIFDWLEDNPKLSGHILDGNSNHLQVLQACILNFELATKIANDEKIITEIGLENLVDLAELMNTSSDLAELLNQLDLKEFKGLAKLLFDKPELLEFLQSDEKGKLLIKIAKTDSNDIIVNAIIDNPDKFKESSDITKIEGNDEYNKLLSKHVPKFSAISSSGGSNSGGHYPNTSDSNYLSIWNKSSDRNDRIRDFDSRYRADDCAIINLNILKRNSSEIPQVSNKNTGSNNYFWIYSEDGKFKVVINPRRLQRIKFNSDAGFRYLFDLKGSNSKGNTIVFIEPAIFEKNGDNYSLLKKGKIELDNI